MLLSTYFLVWPAISAGVMALLVVALIRDLKQARQEGNGMV
jgi:hypothetical protein